MGESWSPAQHELVQWEVEVAYWRGYEQGRRDHKAELEAWAEEFCNSAPGAVATPLAERYAAVVRSLVQRAVAP